MKKDKIIFWSSTLFIFLFQGMMPLFALLFSPENSQGSTLDLGYPAYFGHTLVTFKILGSIALLLTRLPRPVKEWVYAGFAFDFIFASISHTVVGGLSFYSFFPFIIFAIMVVSYLYNMKLYHNGVK